MSTDYDYNKLAQPFSFYQELSDGKIKTSEDPDYSDIREVKIKKLRNRYYYYLDKYDQAYSYYLLFTSKNTKQKISGSELQNLKNLIVGLNNKLMDIAKALKENNDRSIKDISSIKQQIELRNKNIADQNKLMKHQNKAFKGKKDILKSEKRMMVLGKVKNNYKWKTYMLLIILNIIVFSILVTLYFKVTSQ